MPLIDISRDVPLPLAPLAPSASDIDEKLLVLLSTIKASTQENIYWRDRLGKIISGQEAAPSIHLGIFIQPFLNFLLEGKKTIESRFSANRQAPFEMAHEGDILLVKASGGPLVGMCRIAYVSYYYLDAESWADIKQFSDALCIQDPEFWQQKAKASYASLLTIDNVVSLSPTPFPKRDRRGWIVLHKHYDT